MRLYLLGIAAAALVLLTSFVLREKNRAELQLQQQNDALAAAAQSVDAELSGCCSTIAQFINDPDLKKYASATERDLQAEVELTYYIYLSTENNPDLVNYYLYYPDANVILSAHSAARAAQNSSFYAAVQAYTSQETAIYTLDVDGRIGFLFPFDSHFYIAYERMRSAPALVFAELDLNTIFSVLPESLQSGRNALYIMDPAGAVIYENTSNRLQTLLSDGMQRLVLSGQGQHICQSVSSLTGWTFYHTTPAATGSNDPASCWNEGCQSTQWRNRPVSLPHSHSSAYSKQASAARRGSIENRTSEKKPSLVPLDMRTQVREGMGVHPVGAGLCSAPTKLMQNQNQPSADSSHGDRNRADRGSGTRD